MGANDDALLCDGDVDILPPPDPMGVPDANALGPFLPKVMKGRHESSTRDVVGNDRPILVPRHVDNVRMHALTQASGLAWRLRLELIYGFTKCQARETYWF
jgi:hypothetical protein